MRNKKGFTLVELLAAIVILGLLIGYGLPTVTRMVTNNRNKIYINDAKKLVSQAEYKLRANNTEIEKPDPGDCIVLSLLYLDNDEFGAAPNKGEYQRVNSFVVVKNTGSQLEYSVMLVEKTKDGGYKGVQLVDSNKLVSSGALNYVRLFNESELIDVETVNPAYINGYLGSDYIGEDGDVEAVYHNLTIADNSFVDLDTPHIVSAQLTSTSHRPFNTLDATLTLKVEDGDTPLNELMVYLSTSNYQESSGNSYGSDNTSFFHDFNFEEMGYSQGSNITLFIVVKDPDGNKDRKKLSYKIHEDSAPIIDDSSTFTKRDLDSSAMLTGTMTLNVEDDYDSIDDLKVCITDSLSNESPAPCDNYIPYKPTFNEDNKADYTIHNCGGSECLRDGTPHYITAYVQDTAGFVTSKTFTYATGLNEAPTFKENVQITCDPEGYPSTGSRDVMVTVRAQDDSDPLSDLLLNISDERGGSQNYNLSGNESDNTFAYHINGAYDGNPVNIVVTVTDTEGESVSQTVSYDLFNATPPVINSFVIESIDSACGNPDLCPTSEGGSVNASISLDITDDFDQASDIRVCVSENESDCADTSSPLYTSYMNYVTETVGITINDDSYVGTEHTFYVYAVDSDGKVSTSSTTYKLYSNRGPTVDNLLVIPVENEYVTEGSLQTTIELDLVDDFDTIDDMYVSLVDGETTVVQDQLLTNYLSGDAVFNLPGVYDGSTHSLTFTIKDSQGAFTTLYIDYEVYDDQPPNVNNFEIYSDGLPDGCVNEAVCPPTEMGKYDVYYYVDASDDFGYDGMQICISENTNCTDFQPYTNFRDADGGVKAFRYRFTPINPSNPWDGSTKHLYAYLKDSVNPDIVEAVESYKIYQKQGPTIFSGPTITEYYDENGMALPVVLFKIDAEDDSGILPSISYCYKLGGQEHCTSYMTYRDEYLLNNSNFFHQSSFTGQTFEIYAKLKDSDNNVVVTNSYMFTAYKDKEPVIESVDAVPGSGSNIDVTFLVIDPLDTYEVCISSGNSCSDYSGEYSGTDKEYHTITHGASGTFNLFVKDSQGNVAKKSFTSGEYTQCSAYYYNKSKVEYTFLPDYTYEILPDPETGHAGETFTNQAITMDRCSGKCYSYNPVTKHNNSSITGFYDRTITYYDRFDSSVLCPSSAVTDMFEANCTYKDCFLKDNNYNRHNIIGAYIYPDEVQWTIQIGETTYTNTSHYKQYESSYNEYDEKITLTETTTRISPRLVNDGLYDYNGSATDPYLRIVEPINDPNFVGGLE